MRTLILTVLIVMFAALFLSLNSTTSLPAGLTNVVAASTAVDFSTGGCQAPPVLTYIIPSDIAASNSQANVNCMAWQDFIALNWQASISTCEADRSVPASKFGQPNNTAPVVWETFKEASEVFQENAAPPNVWCYQKGESNARRVSAIPAGYKVLGANVTQPNTNGAWLTDQNGNLTLYEIRLNQDEFNYIDQNQLYSAPIQKMFANGPGIDLPDGTAKFAQYGKTGSMEFKASWVELRDPSQWQYFKTSKAYIINQDRRVPPRLVTVGLVGLHVIHKTAKAPQFIWATFEHVNNAPSTADIQKNTLLPWYTYYNRNCDRQTDYYQCAANAQPRSQSPEHPQLPHHPADPHGAAIQVVRENPINDTMGDNIAGLNRWVWELIRQSNPQSVFLNYQLVDVSWSSAPASVPPGSRIPLTSGNPMPNPGTQKVVNTTMETYFQNTSTCLDCHASAPIAAAQKSKAFASDYSFLFSRASAPRSGKIVSSARK
ncbi:MAG TPA: hypothetical protein VG649_23735 [Candidatus Angelobacter sp.]|nr:hypothetical protein [Candidatus Angelobacter sp.]